MADNTKIEWTDATWNVVNGCAVVSPGCKHCYAMKQAHRFPVRQGLTMKTAGGMVWTGEVRFNEAVLTQPLRWKRPRRIFVCAHGDLFHEKVPDEWIDRVFAVMAGAPQHVFQVLTKRPERMRDYVSRLPGRVLEQHGSWEGFGDYHLDGVFHRSAAAWPLPNVWLGVSVEDQTRADERIPVLLDTPAAVRWLSMEPLLGPVNLKHWLFESFHEPKLDWIVLGGESGPGARPMHPDWARAVRDQCAAAGVPFLFKQWGDWFPYGHIDADGHQNSRDLGERLGHWYVWPDAQAGPDRFSARIGKKQAGRLLDGVQHDGYPA